MSKLLHTRGNHFFSQKLTFPQIQFPPTPKPNKTLSLSFFSLSKFTLSLSRNSFDLSLEFTLQSVMDRLCERDMWYDEMKNAKRIMEQLEEVLMMEGVPEICPWGGRIVDIISENDPSRGHSLSS